MVARACNPSYSLRRLRQENCLNPGGGGGSGPRSCPCTPAWVTRAKLGLKKEKKKIFDSIHWADGVRIGFTKIERKNATKEFI